MDFPFVQEKTEWFLKSWELQLWNENRKTFIHLVEKVFVWEVTFQELRLDTERWKSQTRVVT